MASKFKKVIALILCLIMSLGILTGCSLVRLDEDAVKGELFAEIKPHTFVFKGDDGAEHNWTSPHVKLTRAELRSFYDANFSNYQSSMGLDAMLEMFSSVMYNQRLLEIYAQYQVEYSKVNSTVKIKDISNKQRNDAWKSIYNKSLETRLYAEMRKIADSFGETAPVQPTSDTYKTETTYPVYGETTDGDSADGADEEVWRADDIVLGADGLTQEQKMRLQATRNLLSAIIDEVGKYAYRMNSDEKSAWQKDREEYNKIKNLPLTSEQMLTLYGDFPKYFSVNFMYYAEQERTLRIDSIKEFAESSVDENVTDQIMDEQFRLFIGNQIANSSTVSAYISGLDSSISNKTPILVMPYDAKQFFVKHILVPFSDAQKEKFTSTSTDPSVQGLSAAQLREIRSNKVSEIMSYEHRNGEDYGTALSISQIRSDIQNTMRAAGDNAYARDQAFTQLIYKYNTDPGAFDNEYGYGLRRDEKSTYMPEFEKAAYDLYDAWEDSGDKFDTRALGGVVESVTDYGVHFMILSSVLPSYGKQELAYYTAHISLNDYFTVSQKQTVGDYLKDKYVTSKKETAYSVFQNTISKELEKEFGDAAKKYDGVIPKLSKEILDETLKG